jgi:hypothetical protein
MRSDECSCSFLENGVSETSTELAANATFRAEHLNSLSYDGGILIGRLTLRMRKRTIFALVCVVFLLGFTLKVRLSFARWAKVQREFESVQVGQSRLTIVGKLGKPNYYSGRCGVIANPLPTCTLEYVYGHPFSPLNPDYYVVSFSSDERVIQADRWSSP